MIILVRHGETVGNAARIVQRDDVPLNERGQRQAERLAERLAQVGVERVLCSDLLRARMTAEPVLQRTGAGDEYSALLRERNMGDLRGRPYSELAADIFAQDFVPPNGESWEVFHRRVDRAWHYAVELATRVRGNLAVITHGLVCASITSRLLGLRTDQLLPARWSNASVTLCAKVSPHDVTLVNCVAHLDEQELDPAAPKL